MSDLISREKAMMEARPEYLNPNQKGHEEYNKAWNDGVKAYWNGLKELPSESEWIPCSERLPEEEGWYLVTIQNDKTRKRRTENDLFAIGIAEAHKHTPYKFCKDGHRQTVIAWMPSLSHIRSRRKGVSDGI